ncbi:hypothetical protein JOE48_006163 [Methylobacterium sp. PvR107]|nr:hypothetical protein [Methylobacterium sp. PvR107]
MRSSDPRSGALFSYVDLEAWGQPDNQLRTIRQFTVVALAVMNWDFSALYAARMVRRSIQPEMLLQAFYETNHKRQRHRGRVKPRGSRHCLAGHASSVSLVDARKLQPHLLSISSYVRCQCEPRQQIQLSS